MPKIVDRDERRVEIIEATWSTLERIGLERMRLSDVAEQAGFTTGVLPTYFRDRQELLEAAFSVAADRMFDRVEAANASVEPGIARIVNALAELLPRPGLPETTAFVAMCFGLRHIGDQLGATYLQKAERYDSLLRQYMRESTDGGVHADGKSIDLVLRSLSTFADGLCIRSLLQPHRHSNQSSRELLTHVVTRLLRSIELSVRPVLVDQRTVRRRRPVSRTR